MQLSIARILFSTPKSSYTTEPRTFLLSGKSCKYTAHVPAILSIYN